MNSEGAYWLVGSDPRACRELRTLEIPLQQFDAVVLCTDGFYRAVDPCAVVGSPGELVSKVMDEGMEAVLGRLREAEREDRECITWPRLSTHDDAAALMVSRDDPSTMHDQAWRAEDAAQ